MAMSRSYADLRNHGADDRCSRRGPGGYALLGRAWVSADRNGPDVHADECLPFGALAEADPRGEAVSASPDPAFARSSSGQHSRNHGAFTPSNGIKHLGSTSSSLNASPSSRFRGFFDAAPVVDQRVSRKGLHYRRWRGTVAVAIRGGGCGGNWSLSCWIRSLSSGSGCV